MIFDFVHRKNFFTFAENEAKQKTYLYMCTCAHDQEKLDDGDYFVTAIVVKISGSLTRCAIAACDRKCKV